MNTNKVKEKAKQKAFNIRKKTSEYQGKHTKKLVKKEWRLEHTGDAHDGLSTAEKNRRKTSK